MIFGGSGGDSPRTLPRIVQLGLSRPVRSLPRSGEPMPFHVTVHEEGAPLTWVGDTEVSADEEAVLVEGTKELTRWMAERHLSMDEARDLADDVGKRLADLLLGGRRGEVVRSLSPTVVLLAVDETVLDLPWELFGVADPLLGRVPVGRIVHTRIQPAPRRDPLEEDREVTILAVENPTSDLAATAAEIDAIEALAGRHRGMDVVVDVVAERDATLDRLRTMLADGRYDMIHFAGHARFDAGTPGSSALVLADGDELTASDVAGIGWAKPPYLVFNSACTSGRAARRRRLVSRNRQPSGLPAAFLAAGVQGYLGHFFPIGDAPASTMASVFYEALFGIRNVGLAVLEARNAVSGHFADDVDLAAFSLTYFGDAGGAERADLAEAAR